MALVLKGQQDCTIKTPDENAASLFYSTDGGVMKIKYGNGCYAALGTSTLTGSGEPSIIPNYIGQEYIDCTGGNFYVASGNTSASDWQLIGLNAFGTGADGNCVITANTVLPAKSYNFQSLIINPGVTVCFCGDCNVIIRVQDCFCNQGIIKMNGYGLKTNHTSTLSYGLLSTSFSSIGARGEYCLHGGAGLSANNSTCVRCGYACGWTGGGAGGNVSSDAGTAYGTGGGSGGGSGGNGTCSGGGGGGNGVGETGVALCGGKGANGACRMQAGSGGAGLCNGGDGGAGGYGFRYIGSSRYGRGGLPGGNGGNGYYGNGGKGGSTTCGGYPQGNGGNGGCSYYGNGGAGGDSILADYTPAQGGVGGDSRFGTGGRGGDGANNGGNGGCGYNGGEGGCGAKGPYGEGSGGKGGDALSIMFGMGIAAKCFYNNCIDGHGGTGGVGGRSYCSTGGAGGKGGDGGNLSIMVQYVTNLGCINLAGGNGGLGGWGYYNACVSCGACGATGVTGCFTCLKLG